MNACRSLDGLWRRLAIEHPDGSGDVTTRVFWLQAGGFYADLRIPADRPAMTAEPEGRSDLPAEVLHALSRQHAFAGQTHVHGDRCTWDRWLDYQPPSQFPDEGRLEFNGRMLVEYGIHARYTEHWWHEEQGEGGYAVFRLQGERDGLLLMNGKYFMRAVDRPVALAQGESISTLCERAAAHELELANLLACEVSFGQCTGKPASWVVLHSTLPWLEGRRAFAAGPTIWQGKQARLTEPLPGKRMRQWQLCAWQGLDMSMFRQEEGDG